MVVDIYDPIRFFGFCKSRDGRERVFFHVSVFVRLSADDKAPPLPGEPVEIMLRSACLAARGDFGAYPVFRHSDRLGFHRG
jgi:cold shock CspA family protein